MKVVILAGGQQSTISEEKVGIPKPMLEIGGKPLLWHIMKYHSTFGFNDFIICGGYKINVIKEYFKDFYIYQSDITVDLKTNTITVHKNRTEDWRVTVVNTGRYSTVGQRIDKIKEHIDDDNFIVTYGDCLSNINLLELVDTHFHSGNLVTLSVAAPTGRNKIILLDSNNYYLKSNTNNSKETHSWANACNMVFHKDAFDYLHGNYDLEQELFPRLAEKRLIGAYKHYGFWGSVETVRDSYMMENMWNAGIAPWKVWV